MKIESVSYSYLPPEKALPVFPERDVVDYESRSFRALLSVYHRLERPDKVSEQRNGTMGPS